LVKDEGEVDRYTAAERVDMSTFEKVGFAILGAGMVADYHRQAIEANAELGARLVTIGHHNPERFDEIIARFGVPCVNHEQLLSDPAVDVVCICTPSGQHAAQAIAAAEAGKHVLVEKPMALTIDDAEGMISACEKRGVKLGVVLQRRVEPLFQHIHQAIQSGDLGDLTLGLVTMAYHRPQAYYDQADWRGTWALDGGGVLMNQGIHLVDLLIWYMGDPEDVEAYADTLHRDIEVEDTLTAMLRFRNGALATITATTTAAPGFPHKLEIFGTRGGIQVEGESVGRWALAEPDKAATQPSSTSAEAEAGAGADPRGIKPTGHIAIVRDFIQAVRRDRSPSIDGREGRRSLATVLAIYKAAGLLG
jgi:UDP-N-acetyl-2-amino-2-deoxyglucuronate dehydrogenase